MPFGRGSSFVVRPVPLAFPATLHSRHSLPLPGTVAPGVASPLWSGPAFVGRRGFKMAWACLSWWSRMQRVASVAVARTGKGMARPYTAQPDGRWRATLSCLPTRQSTNGECQRAPHRAGGMLSSRWKGAGVRGELFSVTSDRFRREGVGWGSAGVTDRDELRGEGITSPPRQNHVAMMASDPRFPLPLWSTGLFHGACAGTQLNVARGHRT